MIRNIRSIAVATMVVSVSGCAIHQKVTPATAVNGSKQICIIENTAVKEGFLNAYRGALEGKGFSVRQLPATAAITDCSVTSTYTANWRWDLAMYMAFAEIKVYGEGKQAGEAIYDSRSGSGNLSKFINAETKIKELVNQLFPGGTGT